MSIRTVGIIFIFSILLLLTFQAVWLYNTYHLEKERIQANLNVYFQEAVKKELILRLKKIEEKDRSISIDTSDEKPDYNDPNATIIELDLEEGLDDVVPQYLLFHMGININLSVLDSLFLDQSKYQLDYLICYKDSINQLLESVGNASLADSRGLFESIPVPIVNKSYVQLISDISVPVVLKQMIAMTIISFLMLLILLVALILQIRYAYNQYRLNKLREDFSQALIHDLKTPLNVIYITLSNFKSGLFNKNPDFGEKSTVMALKQVLNIQSLVDRILTIARLEENKMGVTFTEIDLPLMVQKLIESYTYAAGKEVLFQASYELDNAPIYADNDLLQNAIGNLIDNAIKYSGDSVTIRISCKVSEGKLFIHVEDNGFGMSEADQLKIFNKFERGAAVFRKGAKGFGLGLSYVRQVAIAHRGTVGLSSVKGRGTEFVIMIPLRLEALGQDELEKNLIE